MAGCEWKMEGKKGLLGIIKKGLCGQNTLGLCGQNTLGLWQRAVVPNIFTYPIEILLRSFSFKKSDRLP